jgi:hypothetical protein
MNQGIRKKGFLKFCIGSLAAVAVGFFHYWLNTRGYEFSLWGFIAFGLPGAYGAAGLLELITGIPFAQLAGKWDELKGWQRGIIGILVVIICFGILIGGLAIWGAMTM